MMLKSIGTCTALAFCAWTQFFPASAGPFVPSARYVIVHDHWSAADERGYRKFVQAIGASDCNTLDSCLHSPANPFYRTDPPDRHFATDCSDLTYILRFYYAWKRGLPFAYVSGVATRDGSGDDIRYSHQGNKVTARTDVLSGRLTGYRIINKIRAAVSSATYRIHPDAKGPLLSDFYSPAITREAIHPGTVIYDPAGHVATVFRVDPDGRVHSFDAHTDYTLTQMVFDVRFARAKPAEGAGFKDWRPVKLVGATRMPDGTLKGGHIVAAGNAEIADFSDEQYYGNGKRPSDARWKSGTFTLNGEKLNYYDFVRGSLSADGKLVFDPLKEVAYMTGSICSDLRYRTLAVQLAVNAGLTRRAHPARLPVNIYGTSGAWEIYSTPSRDARLKTLFKALRDTVQRFVEMERSGHTEHLDYKGRDLASDMLKIYNGTTKYCRITYRRSDGSPVTLSYDEARKRLFAMSFDPYNCPERRWGAGDPAELSTCTDGPVKTAWYEAEQDLRNQIDRTYDARMDFTLAQLGTPGPGKGVASPPDTDVRAYLQSVMAEAQNRVQRDSEP